MKVDLWTSKWYLIYFIGRMVNHWLGIGIYSVVEREPGKPTKWRNPNLVSWQRRKYDSAGTCTRYSAKCNDNDLINLVRRSLVQKVALLYISISNKIVHSNGTQFLCYQWPLYVNPWKPQTRQNSYKPTMRSQSFFVILGGSKNSISRSSFADRIFAGG